MKVNNFPRPIRPLFIPPESDLLRQPGQIILKDGTAAELRVAWPADVGRHRSFSECVAANAVGASLCESWYLDTQVTLAALRTWQDQPPPWDPGL
jgi:hypothetical protein